VHEAYLRLIDQTRVQWQNRAHFFAVAAQVMRRILVDHARRRGAAKRGGPSCQVPLEDEVVGSEARDVGLVDLADGLLGLPELDPERGRIVELRFFGGLSIEEAAEVLGVSSATVKRDWRMAKAWLHRRITTRSA